MNIYKITFAITEEEGYGPNKKAFAKHNTATTEKVFLSIKDKTLLIPAHSVAELVNYANYGGGMENIELVGTLPDKHFQPLIAEAEFVKNQIASKKNGTPLGFQG